MTARIFLYFLVFVSVVAANVKPAEEEKIWLSELDLTKMSCAMCMPKIDQSFTGTTMQMAGEKFTKGVGTLAYSRMLIDLHGKGKKFSAKVGLDDTGYIEASISFFVLGDEKVLWQSGPVKKGGKAKPVDVDLTGVKKLGLLVTVNNEHISENYANWAEAEIVYVNEKPVAMENAFQAEQYGILTPAAPNEPRINTPGVYGVSPDAPILYRVPVTGSRPVSFAARGLPTGLKMDGNSGFITGKISKPGKYTIVIKAKNIFGTTKKKFTIIAGDKLALTPPMGWNSWYVYYHNVSDSFMRQAADAMVSSGMANYGYQYVNIDDCWMNKPGTSNAEENGPLRDADGRLLGNKRFPDMKGLTAYIHGKGLKAGIYSSPGPTTCARYAGSYEHEVLDAKTFAEWGFDFLKYDWCSYGSIAKGNSVEVYKAPYVLMGNALKQTGRDIIHNLCQYGMGEVWKWGREMGHSWRTGPDLGTATGSFVPGFYNTGLNNSQHWEYAGPGAWNDPDYINIGWVGSSRDKNRRKTAFTNNEQYAYMTMWSLMAAPLFFSGDMSRLDSFLLNVLCNHEVIGVNQDVLGKQAKIIRNDDDGMLMVKELADGSKAIGLFNYPGSKKNPADYFVWDNKKTGTRKLKFTAKELGINGKFKVRDIWQQKNLGVFETVMELNIPYHAVAFLKISR